MKQIRFWGVVACHFAVVGCGGATVEPDAGTDGGSEAASEAGCTDPNLCAPDAPRPLAPHSTGLVTSPQPTLRFTAAAKATSYAVQLCSDAACNSVLETVTTSTTSATPTAPLPRGPVYWRVDAKNGALSTSSVTWEFFVGHGSAPNATSWLGPPDFDRNGVVDVALGSGSNKVYVMMGQPGSGLPATNPTTTLAGTAGFGSATANAGDVNGDGYGDLVAGGLDPMSPAVSVYYGGTSGLKNAPLLLPVQSGTMYLSVAGAGDVDGDGYADVLVSAGSLSSLYSGGAKGMSTTPSGGALPGRAAGAGDVNGDGFADVLVCDGGSQLVMVYFGSASGLGNPQTIPPPSSTQGFGETCITAGDVNGDGFADVLVATQGTASAYVFYGSSSGVGTTGVMLAGGAGGGGAGVTTSIASAGDVNGDGYGDVIIGGYNANTVLVYQGGASGISTTATTTFSALPSGEYANSVASVGDPNGDGYDDIAFAPSQCSGYAVYVFPGSASGVTTTAPLDTWSAPSGAQCFGIIAR